jgi:hypothetical protein
MPARPLVLASAGRFYEMQLPYVRILYIEPSKLAKESGATEALQRERNRSHGKIDFFFALNSIRCRHSPPKPLDSDANFKSGGLAHRHCRAPKQMKMPLRVLLRVGVPFVSPPRPTIGFVPRDALHPVRNHWLRSAGHPSPGPQPLASFRHSPSFPADAIRPLPSACLGFASPRSAPAKLASFRPSPLAQPRVPALVPAPRSP